jgi:hypothetical protein
MNREAPERKEKGSVSVAFARLPSGLFGNKFNRLSSEEGTIYRARTHSQTRA